MGVEDTKFRILLPSAHCSVHDLPDSDGEIRTFFPVDLLTLARENFSVIYVFTG